ncbi:MAG: nuclear transport factor 2 family protein [Solirubrobacterales bacterium]
MAMRGDGAGGTLTVDGASVRERPRTPAGGSPEESVARRTPEDGRPAEQAARETAPQASFVRPAEGLVAGLSQEGVVAGLSKEEVVAGLFEAFSRRDLPGALALVHPEVVFQPMTAAVTRAGEPYRGHEGLRRYAEDIESYWEELTIHPGQIRAAGRAVVALGLVSGRGPAGSFEDAPTTWVVKFRDGMVAHAQIFSDERNVVSALVGEDV